MQDQRIRIAQYIRDQLLAAQRVQWGERIERVTNLSNELNRFQQIQGQLARARRCGLDGAVRRLAQRIEIVLRDARYNLELAHRNISQPPKPILTLRELVGELDQLETELGPWEYQPVDHRLSVSTEPIELDGVYLGPFEIELMLGELSSVSRRQPFQVLALDPNPAASAEHVTHPHVSDNNLCAGDATTALMAALETGRICDFFLIVRQVLSTYNPESPYVSLEQWDGESCHDCGCVMYDDCRGYCENCGHDFCDECTTYCRSCDETRCLGCVTTCDHCEEVFCGHCMDRCAECDSACCVSCLEDQLCPDCHEQKEQEHAPEEQETGTVEQRQAATPTPSETQAA